jgi:hypothetical protein
MPLSRSLAAIPLACLALAGCGGSGQDATVILNTKRVELAIKQSVLQQRRVRAEVDCPSGVHQGKGLTFLCTATTRRGSTTFVVRQPDDKGHVTYAAR